MTTAELRLGAQATGRVTWQLTRVTLHAAWWLTKVLARWGWLLLVLIAYSLHLLPKSGQAALGKYLRAWWLYCLAPFLPKGARRYLFC